MKNRFVHEFLSAAKRSPRMYFAPLVGAVRAVRNEVQGGGQYRAAAGPRTRVRTCDSQTVVTEDSGARGDWPSAKRTLHKKG